MRCVIIVFLWTFAITAQIKDDISVVQYTAGFASEISLKSFKDYNTQTLYIEKNGDIFKKEKIKFLPTLVLYNDGKDDPEKRCEFYKAIGDWDIIYGYVSNFSTTIGAKGEHNCSVDILSRNQQLWNISFDDDEFMEELYSIESQVIDGKELYYFGGFFCWSEVKIRGKS